jgi:hypothetical protein
MLRTETTTTRPRVMAQHALRCTTCKGNVAVITNSTDHLAKLEAMAAIEWCTYRKSGRRMHA